MSRLQLSSLPLAEFTMISEFLKQNSPAMIFATVLVFALKYSLEKTLDHRFSKLGKVAEASLNVQQKMREDERGELVSFRSALEEWSYFLETCPFRFTGGSKSIDVASLMEEDRKLFLKVRLTAVRAAIYLRDASLEQSLLANIVRLRQTYYPILNQFLPKLGDLQASISRIWQTHAPTEADRAQNSQLQQSLTTELASFSESLLNSYPEIAKQMTGLRDNINRYIYRVVDPAEMESKQTKP